MRSGSRARPDETGPELELDGRPFIDNRGFIAIGARVRLCSAPVQSHLVVSRGGRLEIGDDVVIHQGAAIAAHELIRIGRGSELGPYTVVSDTDFHVAGDKSAKAPTTPVVIGSNVRIGARTTILRGTSIGDGARIVAGSVVSGEVPAGALFAGVPARPVTGLGTLPADGSGDLAEAVAAVAAKLFDLDSPPALEATPDDIEAWDSLGTLRLLLTLEDAFGVTIDDREMAKARSIGDLAGLVSRLREARS